MFSWPQSMVTRHPELPRPPNLASCLPEVYSVWPSSALRLSGWHTGPSRGAGQRLPVHILAWGEVAEPAECLRSLLCVGGREQGEGRSVHTSGGEGGGLEPFFPLGGHMLISSSISMETLVVIFRGQSSQIKSDPQTERIYFLSLYLF